MRLHDIAPNFVLVIGGAGSGKNHYIEHNSTLSNYLMVDVDQIKIGVDLDTAIKSIKPMLEDAFKEGINVVHPSTGSNYKGNYNKIELAKKYGYNVTIILIDTDPEQTVLNVQKRVDSGGHDVKLAAIISSNEKARANFEQLKQFANDAKVISK